MNAHYIRMISTIKLIFLCSVCIFLSGCTAQEQEPVYFHTRTGVYTLDTDKQPKLIWTWQSPWLQFGFVTHEDTLYILDNATLYRWEQDGSFTALISDVQPDFLFANQTLSTPFYISVSGEVTTVFYFTGRVRRETYPRVLQLTSRSTDGTTQTYEIPVQWGSAIVVDEPYIYSSACTHVTDKYRTEFYLYQTDLRTGTVTVLLQQTIPAFSCKSRLDGSLVAVFGFWEMTEQSWQVWHWQDCQVSQVIDSEPNLGEVLNGSNYGLIHPDTFVAADLLTGDIWLTIEDPDDTWAFECYFVRDYGDTVIVTFMDKETKYPFHVYICSKATGEYDYLAVP